MGLLSGELWTADGRCLRKGEQMAKLNSEEKGKEWAKKEMLNHSRRISGIAKDMLCCVKCGNLPYKEAMATCQDLLRKSEGTRKAFESIGLKEGVEECCKQEKIFSEAIEILLTREAMTVHGMN